ncbi:tail fiber domain-containing protein [Hymenobacter koreensis]|uniref:Peptidase S74 domain-containing protein n=1 Tax=Hymenobacter koreensis TaxID=1084523 RepID=A0ABP8J1C9_9BACT
MPHFSTSLQAALIGLSLLPATALAQAPDKLVDVKTAAGVSRFSVDVNGGLLGGGEFSGFSALAIPAEGSGTRLMWYPDKAAFRAGSINGTQWDDANIGLYSMALGGNVRASGDYAFASGNSTAAVNVGSTAMGQYCTASGAASVALGNYAHTNTRQGSFVFADRSVVDDGNSLSDESFRAPNNHSAFWRVTGGFRVVTGGTGNTFGYDATRGVSILPASTILGSSTTNWGQSTALIATSSGAYLSDGGVWTNASDRNRKNRIEPVSGEDVLRRLRQVPITRWSYKTDPATVRHLGPMAQDFRRAFGLGQDSVSIGTVDADGVALAGVQALDARTQTQGAQLAALQAENQALRARLAALEQRSVAAATSPWSGASLPVAALLLASVGVGAFFVRRS